MKIRILTEFISTFKCLYVGIPVINQERLSNPSTEYGKPKILHLIFIYACLFVHIFDSFFGKSFLIRIVSFTGDLIHISSGYLTAAVNDTIPGVSFRC